jgi:hypothetical protein
MPTDSQEGLQGQKMLQKYWMASHTWNKCYMALISKFLLFYNNNIPSVVKCFWVTSSATTTVITE